MSIATLLHNPSAGEESYTENELVSLINKEGIELIYSSVKEDQWDVFDAKTNFLIIAGGDGTVRKVTKRLMVDKLNTKYPIALLPAGTANNIARSLGLPEKEEEVIKSWKLNQKKHFDIGIIRNLDKQHFFLESFGFGVFPVLMEAMQLQDDSLKDTPEKKLSLALELLREILKTFKPFSCDVEVDGNNHAGKFLLVEIMNTQSIGPNLTLSPHSDPGDGELEVIFIPENQKDKLVTYICNKLDGIEVPDFFDTCKAKNVRIKCDHYLAHIDDETIEINDVPEIEIELDRDGLEFLI